MSLGNAKLFFDNLRDGIMGPTLDAGEVDGVKLILHEMAGQPKAFVAYVLATAWHETAHSMLPVLEAHWLNPGARDRYFFRMYDPQGQRPRVAAALGNTQPGDGVRFAGRGFVQLTGRANYARAGTILGVDLISAPDRAMVPGIAAAVLVQGMLRGWFTDKRLADYLPAGKGAMAAEFRNARRIVNGIDKAAEIAGHAVAFQLALDLGGWSA